MRAHDASDFAIFPAGTSFARVRFVAPSRSREKVLLAHALLVGLTAAVGCSSTSPLNPDAGATGTTKTTGRDGGTEAGSGGTSGASRLGGANGTTERVPQNHRANNAQCLDVAPMGAADCPLVASAPASDCQTDSQCTSGLNGRCENNGGGPAGCNCSYDTCTRDDACQTGGPCACHGSPYLSGGNVCAPGNCQIDSDCGAGGFCSPSLSPMSCFSLSAYYCHTPNDQCVDDADCPKDSGSRCMYDVTARRWQCQQTMSFLCAV
jgi:hypothetical protein